MRSQQKAMKDCTCVNSEKKIFFWPIETKTGMNIMAEENVMAEVMSRLEAEPAPATLPPALSAIDIPALREQLAILVSTGKCKEAISVNLTQTSEAAR